MSLITKDHLSITIQTIKTLLSHKADKVTDKETIAALIDADMLPAVQDSSGAILTDADGNIVLRY